MLLFHAKIAEQQRLQRDILNLIPLNKSLNQAPAIFAPLQSLREKKLAQREPLSVGNDDQLELASQTNFFTQSLHNSRDCIEIFHDLPILCTLYCGSSSMPLATR